MTCASKPLACLPSATPCLGSHCEARAPTHQDIYYSSCLLLFTYYNLSESDPISFHHFPLREQCTCPTSNIVTSATMQTASPRPSPLHISKSFSRLDSPSPDRVRSESTSLHNGSSSP